MHRKIVKTRFESNQQRENHSTEVEHTHMCLTHAFSCFQSLNNFLIVDSPFLYHTLLFSHFPVHFLQYWLPRPNFVGISQIFCGATCWHRLNPFWRVESLLTQIIPKNAAKINADNLTKITKKIDKSEIWIRLSWLWVTVRTRIRPNSELDQT